MSDIFVYLKPSGTQSVIGFLYNKEFKAQGMKQRCVVLCCFSHFHLGNKFFLTFCIKVAFELVVNDNLGLMIRGGIEYGLGIYITGVDEESAAFRNGLRVSKAFPMRH